MTNEPRSARTLVTPALASPPSRHSHNRGPDRARLLLTGALFTLATSIIWGVNTLFLLDAGLDIFGVMLVNATFSAGQIVFEVPTGVVADTVGRRVSFLLGIGALMVATLGYVGSAVFGWGMTGFILASILLGLRLHLSDRGRGRLARGRPRLRPAIRGARTGSSPAAACSTASRCWWGRWGADCWARRAWPCRTWCAPVCCWERSCVTLAFMRDIGFQPRPLKVSRFGEESRKIFGAGITHGWRHPVIRPLLFASLVNGLLDLVPVLRVAAVRARVARQGESRVGRRA